jgi:acyl-CoA reductase-like NAD-dependent aldehyde dehydrogenase
MSVGIRLGGFFSPTIEDIEQQAATCERCAELQRRQRERDKLHRDITDTIEKLRDQLALLDSRTADAEGAAIEHGHAANSCPTLRDCASVHESTGRR